MNEHESNMIADILRGHIIPLCISIGEYKFLFHLRMTSMEIMKCISEALYSHKYYEKYMYDFHNSDSVVIHDKYEYIVLTWWSSMDLLNVANIYYGDPDDYETLVVANTCDILYIYDDQHYSQLIESGAHYKAVINSREISNKLRRRGSTHIMDIITTILTEILRIQSHGPLGQCDILKIKNLTNMLVYLNELGYDTHIIPPDVSQLLTK